jgi:hypothetical protein
MWVRRSDIEVGTIERRNRWWRLNPLGPFLVAAALTIFVAFVPRGPRPTFSLTVVLLTFFVVFTLSYVSQVVFGRYQFCHMVHLYPSLPIQREMICGVCRTAQFDRASHLCACGGRLEPLEYWRWADEHNLPPSLI